MKNQRGFSLLELLIVLVMLLLMILLVVFALIGKIDEARGSVLTSQARMAQVAAQIVILESKAETEDIEDEVYEAGLTGTVSNVALPVESMLSRHINQLLSTDLVLSDEPAEGEASVSFKVEQGVITETVFTSSTKGKWYQVVITDGDTVVTRVK